jgi:hypothetical protein
MQNMVKGRGALNRLSSNEAIITLTGLKIFPGNRKQLLQHWRYHEQEKLTWVVHRHEIDVTLFRFTMNSP